MVRRIIVSVIAAIAVGCQTTSGYSPARDLEIFEFHSAVWVNLHHYLYNEAFRPQAHQEPFVPFESSEKEQMEKAVAFYKSKFDGRDLLFDKGLRKINNELASAESKENLFGLDIQESGLREILETVHPIYLKRFWEEQNRQNTRWIADVQEKLKLYGAPIKTRLEEIIRRKFTDGPYRIDVVHEANWAGGYTYTPPHTVLSSGRKTYSEYSALEMIFHETLHAGPFETVADALEKELASHQLKDDDQLWHALHFFTAGEVTCEVLKSNEIEYVSYAYANKLFSEDRKWGKFEPLIRKFWLPYMQGQVDMGTAIKNIVGSIGSMKPN